MLVGALVTTSYGCQQSDQVLPFEIDPTARQTLNVGTAGGLLSLPPNFSIEFFNGSLAGSESVTAQLRLEAFPPDAGLAVPGRAFDVGPSGVVLSPDFPAEVKIAVPEELLAAGGALTLSVGVLRPDNSIVTDATIYDLTSGILTASVYELGPMAAVIANDAIAIEDIADLPSLDGGAITPVSPPPAGGPASAPPTRPDGVVFSAECSPGERSCFTSGISKLWVDDIVQERLGSEMVLLNTTVEASVEFFSFNINSLPDSAIGYLRIDGELRARINQVVVSRQVGDQVGFYTGTGSDPDNPGATSISISGGLMTFDYTSEGEEIVAFDVSGVGTSELLTLELDGELEFKNADASSTFGDLIAHVRLRK